MIVQLKKKYQCKELIEELDELVKKAVSLFDNFSSCRTSSYNVQKIKRFETIILDHLIVKTNFESVFESIKTSYGDVKQNFHTIIYNILCQIGKKRLNPNFSNFLIVLDDKIKELKKKPIKKYTFYIPVRIETQLNNVENKNLRKKLKKATSLSVRKIPKKITRRINSQNLKSLFASRQIILKIDIKARDYISPIRLIERKTSTFLGALAFSKYYRMDTEKWSYSSSDMSITRDPSDNYLLIIENSKNIVYPHNNQWQIVDSEVKKDVKLTMKEIWSINDKENDSYQRLITILDLLSKQEPKIKEISEDSLKLYLEAITEKQLEISFLKFWIITERILKQGGNRNDTSILYILKKLIKEKHLKRMIDGLYKKRNDLVHEFKINMISQQDRNLAKAIAESTLLFLIDPPTKINNLQELRILIDNIFSSKEELAKKKKIINKIIKVRK
jgi:hypothetical protein